MLVEFLVKMLTVQFT